MVVKVGKEGKVVIPKNLRTILKIEPGDFLYLEVINGQVVISKLEEKREDLNMQTYKL